PDGRAVVERAAGAVPHRRRSGPAQAPGGRRAVRLPPVQLAHCAAADRRGAVVNRFDCMTRLASWLDGEVITVTNLTTNAAQWTAVWDKGPRFYGVHMGLCLPFACGLSLAFPKRQVVALDGDGSLLIDTSALVTA